MGDARESIDDPVVVVGFAFRLPQDVVSEESFWDTNYHRLSTNTEVPLSRYNIDGHHSSIEGHQGVVSSRSGHFIKGDILAFDAPFFKMSGAEAKAMDPQIRLLLETTYHAFESAGIPMENVVGSNTSVYVGNLIQEYTAMFAYDTEVNPQYAGTGNSFAMLSNRISWTYDLRGSSVSVDSACSSGLVGLELACQSLLRGESEMSLVGGVQLQLDPRVMTAGLSRLGFLSPDGHCYSFDDRANGYARGEGVAVMVLKRLSKAIQDGDTIRGVIRSFGSNQDGRTPSIALPSSTAQAALIRNVYDKAGLDYDTTGYFEAHATGTPVGDPIEARGIGLAFSDRRRPESPINVGSHKANIGHTESLAGIAGMVKCILMMERGIILPNGRLKSLNPGIDAEKWRLKFPTSPAPWPTQGLRRASVNSFGYGGTNAHVVLDDAGHYLQSHKLQVAHNTLLRTTDEGITGQVLSDHHGIIETDTGRAEAATDDLIFLLSAADEQGIERQAEALSEYLGQSGKVASQKDLRNLAFTLSNRRSVLPWKSYALASTVEELQARLIDGRHKPVRASESPQLCFVFTGQGAQWPSMGAELLAYPRFKESMQVADLYLQSLGCTWSILEELLRPASSSRIDQPELAQPLCTALQVALVDLLESWHISPQAVVGHSSGEIAAAYAAGLLDRDSALRVAYFRGKCVAELLGQESLDTKGAMLAVGLSEAQLEPYILSVIENSRPRSLTCACINSPQSTTVSGDEAEIDELSRLLQADQVFSRKLNVPVAYHSQHMRPVADDYRSRLEGHLSARTQNVPAKERPILISSVTGKQTTTDEMCKPEYWVQNLVSQVRFAGALQTMCSTLAERDQGIVKRSMLLLEVGPHCALERPVKDTLGDQFSWVYDTALRRNHPAADCVKRMAGRLFTQAYSADIQAINACGRPLQEPRMLIDLPRYQFNHSQSYSVESRASYNLRMRESPRHELLGIQSGDWNPLDPTWRIIIRQSDLPWLSHHMIDNTVLYPAGGMLAMVLEGIRYLSKGSSVSGFRLRDVVIGSALVVPSTEDGVEAQLHFSSHDAPTSKQGRVWKFWIHSVTGEDWKLHCSGQVSAEGVATSDEVSMSQEAQGTISARHDQVRGNCATTIDSADFYQVLRNNGVQFGELFRTLYNLRYDETAFSDNTCDSTVYQATAEISFQEWRRQVEDHKASEHLIHPSTLDGLIHLLFASVFKELPDLPNMIPTQISEAYFSSALLDNVCGGIMNLYGGVIDRGLFGLAGEVTAVNLASNKLLVQLRGLQLTGFHQASDSRRNGLVEETSLFHQFTWKPDISLLSTSELQKHCLEATDGDVGDGIDAETEALCRHFMSTALQYLSQSANQIFEPHVSHYINWTRKFLDTESLSTKQLYEKIGFVDENPRPGLIQDYSAKLPQNELLVSFGQQLGSILNGETDTSGAPFHEKLAQGQYYEQLGKCTAKRLSAYIDLLAHKNSDLSIIEIGAGTGVVTAQVLEVLSQHGNYPGASLKANQYDFTDPSADSVASAREQFAQYGGRMSFKTSSLNDDFEEQGFDCGKYDVVIATSLLHMTGNLDHALRNVKKLLKPGGLFISGEPTNRRAAAIPFVLGLNPSWWHATSESSQEFGPLLSRESWHEALLRTGFDGLQLFLPDGNETSHTWSLLASRSLEAPSPIKDHGHKASVIIVTETPEQESLAIDLQVQIKSSPDMTCRVRNIETADPWQDGPYDQCISLLEIGGPVMSKMTKPQFAALREMLDASRQIIWVTENCGLEAQNPESATNIGFARTVTREKSGLSWLTVNVQSGPQMVQTIMRLLERTRTVPQDQQETEITEVDGAIWIPRVVEAPHINKLMDSEIHGYKPQPVEVGGGKAGEDSLELRFSPGRLDSFHFGHDAMASQPLRSNEVRVSVKATGINFKDIMVALNQVSDDHIGQEFAGVITEVGPDNEGSFSIGDRVCGIEIGTFHSTLRARPSRIVRIPKDMSFVEATAIPLAYATAQYGLKNLTQLRSGETILIHAAAGAVGQAAIHLAQKKGAVIYATVSTSEKKSLLKDRYGLQDWQFFSSRHTTFAKQIMDATGGRGVDVVLNSLAGQALIESWRCLAPFGRFVEIGKRDMSTFKALPMEPFMRNVSFCSLDINVVLRQNDALMGEIMRDVQALVDEEPYQLAPQPVTVFKRSGFEEAFRLLQTGRHVGKVVVDWEQQDTLQVVSKSPLDYKFDASATYVISGGLGGIGRSIASWMCEQGARHLVLLSRSGPKTDAAKELVTTLTEAGVVVHTPACDIADRDSVMSVTRWVQENMPPVKGCIQASMALDNRLFENYDLPAFQTAFEPKVKGTFNLHECLPSGLDFFVLLSSLSSIHGAVSQSNYAAANSFLDAFARFRHAAGQRCTAINLGIVESVGYIAERQEVLQNMSLAYVDHKSVRESDVHFLLKFACNPHLNTPATDRPWESQILAALTTPAFVKRGGVMQDHGWMRAPVFRHLYRMELSDAAEGTVQKAESMEAQLREAKSQAQAADVITQLFARRLARSLGVPVEDIDVNRPPHAFGVDSLVAVELIFWFSNEVRADVAVVQILGSLTIAQLCWAAAEKSEFFNALE